MSSIAQPVARSVSRSVLAGQRMNLGYLIRSMFSNSEQGFTQTLDDYSTLFQDAAGTTPVTGAGQPAGLVLDKSKGLVLGNNIVINGDFNTDISSWAASSAGITANVTNGILDLYRSAGGGAGLYQDISTSKWSKITIRARRVGTAGTSAMFRVFGLGSFATQLAQVTLATSPTLQDYVVYVPPLSGGVRVYFQVTDIGAELNADFIKVEELAGNHAYQTTSAQRPLLQNSPRKIDYDGVDDKLTVNLPAQLTGCTVIRAIPNVGTQILTNQTIPTPYNDSTDHCGLIVINRALTQTETAQITQIFNRLAGV